MSEMIERVARALWRLDNPVEDGFSQAAPNDWGLWPNTGRQSSLAQVDHSRDDYREQARAAIAAMWDPTEAMVLAAWEVGKKAFDDSEVYQAMIDAALQGTRAMTALCEWSPLPGRAAESGDDSYACQSPATVCVGADGRWHLCSACSALPWFKRLKKTPLKAPAP